MGKTTLLNRFIPEIRQQVKAFAWLFFLLSCLVQIWVICYLGTEYQMEFRETIPVYLCWLILVIPYLDIMRNQSYKLRMIGVELATLFIASHFAVEKTKQIEWLLG